MEEEYSVRKMSADKAFGKTASELNGVTKPSKIKQLSDPLHDIISISSYMYKQPS